LSIPKIKNFHVFLQEKPAHPIQPQKFQSLAGILNLSQKNLSFFTDFLKKH